MMGAHGSSRRPICTGPPCIPNTRWGCSRVQGRVGVAATALAAPCLHDTKLGKATVTLLRDLKGFKSI